MQRFKFITRCVEANGDDITEMTEQSKDITAATFKKHCEWVEIAESLGYHTGNGKPKNTLRLENDYAVKFCKSTYQGKPCYYFVWSAIEYVFTTT